MDKFLSRNTRLLWNIFRCMHTSKSKRAWLPKNSYDDLLTKLQSYMESPLLSEENYVFKPSWHDIDKSQAYFEIQKGETLIPYKGVIMPEALHKFKSIPEVAFLGRSNVGKSSLINALFYEPPGLRIKISKKPGATTVLKQYKLGKRLILVDMPGYGTNMPEYFASCVEPYLQYRENLVRTFLLVDGNTGPTPEDYIAIEMMEEFGKPYVLVFTKVDKCSAHKMIKMLMSVLGFQQESMPSCFVQPFLVSSSTGNGLPHLRAFIAHVTGQLKLTRA